MTFSRCDCRERSTPAPPAGKERECCFIKSHSILETIEPKCNIQKESKMLRQPNRQVKDVRFGVYFFFFHHDVLILPNVFSRHRQ